MDQYENLSDPQLVALLKEDELSAFAEIYNRYWSALFASAYNRVRDEEICKEIVQDVFTAFWSKRETLVLTAGLSNYLFRAVKYQVIDHFRKQAIRRSYLSRQNAETADDSNLQWVLLRDLQQHLDSLVDSLPDKCKSVYRLSKIENRSNREIAQMLDISEKTVEGHLTKALKILRVNLSHFLTLSLLMSLLK